jgi:hypothetical protein
MSDSIESARDPAANGYSYDEYVQIRTQAAEASQRSQQRLDELITVGAAGTLVLSITFMEKIAPHPWAGSRLLLAAGWLILIIALGCALSAHASAARAHLAYVYLLDSDYRHKRTSDPTKLSAHRVTKGLNIASFTAFLLGTALLVCFAFANIPFEESPSHVTGSQTSIRTCTDSTKAPSRASPASSRAH